MKNVRFLDIKKLSDGRLQLVYEVEDPDHPGFYAEFSVKTHHRFSKDFGPKWEAMVPHALQACELMPSTAAWQGMSVPLSLDETESIDGQMVELVKLTEIKWKYSKDGDEIPSVQFFCEMQMKRSDDVFAFKTPFKPEVARTASQEMLCLEPDAQLAILQVVTCAEKYILAVYSQMEMFDYVTAEKPAMAVAGGED